MLYLSVCGKIYGWLCFLGFLLGSGVMRGPSMEALEILAVSDGVVFEGVLGLVGLRVEGLRSVDPLLSEVQSEAIVSLASELTEDVYGLANEDVGLGLVKAMAEDYGYIVSYV